MTDVKPTREKSSSAHDDYTETHPAYAVIGGARVSSTGHRLFGSDFRHNGFVTIRIQHAQVSRGLSRDWVHTTSAPTIAEVSLSEAQWATFVSTLNMGEGVPCTLIRHDGESIPGIEPDSDRRAEFNAEIGQHLTDTLATLEELREAAPTKRLREKVEHAIMQLRSNLPFVAHQFDAHAEQTVEKAKIEVAAYVSGALQRAGMAALGGQRAPFLLDTDAGGDDR